MKRHYPWLIAGFISILAIVQAVLRAANAAAPGDYIFEFASAPVAVLLCFMGALIVVRQGGNWVGWLMMLVALAFSDPFSFLATFYPQAPTNLTPGFWLLLWVQSWFFFLGIISMFQIVLRFPTGRPPSDSWKWINTVTIAALLIVVLSEAFDEEIGPNTGAWAVDNPLGFLPSPVIQGFTLLLVIGMIILAGGSLISLIFRFRHASFLEREQIKWLYFAGALFILAFALLIAYWSTNPAPGAPSWQEFFFLVSVLAFPLAIGTAILRYRLYDIDIIIRRTSQYAVLTGLLVLMYFGGIIAIQGILAPLTGELNSPLVIVITTLGIAAIFNPLRRRVQGFIDRRFFRKKYDAEKALDRFTAALRDDADIFRITDAILRVVEETVQPETASVWLKDDTRQEGR